MKRLTAILVVLFALIAAPAAAQEGLGDEEMRGFMHPGMEMVMIAAEFDIEDAFTARYVISQIDDDFVEEHFGGTVVISVPLDRGDLRDINADAGKMFGIVMSGETVVMVVASNGPLVYIFAYGGEGMDSKVASDFTRDTIAHGVERAPVPSGFTEVDIQNWEDAFD